MAGRRGAGPRARGLLLLLLLLLVLVAPAAADDGEVVLVEDISGRSARSRVTDDPAPREPAVPPATATPREKKPPRRRDEAPTVDGVTERLTAAEEQAESLRLATRDYGTALFDADHMDAMAKLRSQALERATQAAAEADRGAKADAAFEPLVVRARTLKAELGRLEKPLQAQGALHLDLMQRTQDVLHHAPPRAHKALRIYINQRLKKQWASSRANLLEMQEVQRETRAKWWLGATTRELRLSLGGMMSFFALYMVIRVNTRHLFPFTIITIRLPFEFFVALGCGVVSHVINLKGVWPYLTAIHIGLQGALLLLLAGGSALLLEQVNRFLSGVSSRQRRRAPP